MAFFCCKNMADNKYRSANTERRIIKNTRKLRMQGGRYETKKDGKGTGIGLTVVKRMVEEHGGWIQVQSEEEKGTTFIMNFPRVDDSK